jgi:DNA-binding NtrC family response regulator
MESKKVPELEEFQNLLRRDEQASRPIYMAAQALMGIFRGIALGGLPKDHEEHRVEMLLTNALTAFANLQDALTKDVELSVAVEQLEKSIIFAALSRHRRQKDVYSRLKISRTTLDAKTKKYGICRR